MMVKMEDMNFINKSGTIGKLKKERINKYINSVTPVGRIGVGVLREFMKRAKLKDDDAIGIYLTKKNKSERVKKGELSLIHSKGWLLAPMLRFDSHDYTEFGDVKIETRRKTKKTKKKKTTSNIH